MARGFRLLSLQGNNFEVIWINGITFSGGNKNNDHIVCPGGDACAEGSGA